MDYPGEKLTREQADAKIKELLPRTDTFVDCAGVKRTFTVYRDYAPGTIGYVFCAQEVVGHEDKGYRFEAFSESCPDQGLGRLYKKIKAGLAAKYLEEDAQGVISMRTDTLSGRLVFGGVNVDGRHICWDDLEEMLAKGFNGQQFELRFFNTSD